MEICLHVVLRQRAEQRLSEFDVLGHFVLEERMNVAKVSDLEPTRLFISTLNEPAPHARLIVQHDQLWQVFFLQRRQLLVTRIDQLDSFVSLALYLIEVDEGPQALSFRDKFEDCLYMMVHRLFVLCRDILLAEEQIVLHVLSVISYWLDDLFGDQNTLGSYVVHDLLVTPLTFLIFSSFLCVPDRQKEAQSKRHHRGRS